MVIVKSLVALILFENEIQQSDWLFTLVCNSMDQAAENHSLKTIDNDLNCCLLSFRLVELF